jgi:alkylation response protein AidB-like acyl-CoA dehydrogenase
MSHDGIKAALEAFLDAEFSPDLSLVEWRKRLVSAGWAAPSWPDAYFGRDFSQAEALVVSQVFAERRVVRADWQLKPFLPMVHTNKNSATCRRS